MASSRVHLVVYQINKRTREEKVVHIVAVILACIHCTLPTDMMGNRDRTVSQHDNTERREVVYPWIIGAKRLILHFRKRSSRALDIAKSFERLATSSDSNRSDRVAAHAQASLREIYGQCHVSRLVAVDQHHARNIDGLLSMVVRRAGPLVWCHGWN